MDAIDGALTMIRALWPQTASWAAGTWQAWGAMLDDLDPSTLAPAIRRVASTHDWPSLAAIREAALAGELAPPVAVALSDRSHPVAREAERLATGSDVCGPTLDARRFERLYRDLAAEWNRRRLAGETMALPGNAAAERRALVRGVVDALRAGEEPAVVLAPLATDVLAAVGDEVRGYAVWSAAGEYRGPRWCAEALAILGDLRASRELTR